MADIDEKRLFSGDLSHPVTREYYYAGDGRALEVGDLASATAALEEIVEQGEGDT